MNILIPIKAAVIRLKKQVQHFNFKRSVKTTFKSPIKLTILAGTAITAAVIAGGIYVGVSGFMPIGAACVMF